MGEWTELMGTVSFLTPDITCLAYHRAVRLVVACGVVAAGAGEHNPLGDLVFFVLPWTLPSSHCSGLGGWAQAHTHILGEQQTVTIPVSRTDPWVSERDQHLEKNEMQDPSIPLPWSLPDPQSQS